MNDDRGHWWDEIEIELIPLVMIIVGVILVVVGTIMMFRAT